MQEDNCFSVLKLKGCCEFVQIDRNWLGSSWNINSCVCVKETVVNLCEYTGIREHLEYKLVCVCVCSVTVTLSLVLSAPLPTISSLIPRKSLIILHFCNFIVSRMLCE